MDNVKELNVVYIGSPVFPIGPAITKRRRFMVDYMNERNITSHVLVTGLQGERNNPSEGIYGNCDYYDIREVSSFDKIFQYNKLGKKYLKNWFDEGKLNVLIFTTSMDYVDFFLYRYAKKLGYKIVFDIVETSFWKHENMGIRTKMIYAINHFLTLRAYKNAAAFVISERLHYEIKNTAPSMPICILPNSTPIEVKSGRKELNETLQILYAGTYASKEGVIFLINGVEKAIAKGYNCKLLLLGKAPEALRNRYKDSEFIEFKGFVSDDELYRLQLESDVLAMVRTNSKFSNYGFPFKLSEYLATGNIVLSTNVSDVKQYLRDKCDAYLIEPENSDAICDAIIHIINNPEEACAIANNGLHVAYDKFSIQNVGKIFEDFLTKL